jgi:hypothetical protein
MTLADTDVAIMVKRQRNSAPGGEAAEARSFDAPAATPKPREIRDPAFAKRLALAADNNPHAPDYGRLTWVKKQLQERFGEEVSVETVRKWFAGEVKPTTQRVNLLAILFEVDEAWLYLGIEPDLAPREQKARNAMVSGVVNVVAGLIQMAGGNVAFPEPDDKRAASGHIDLYAIIKGAQYAFHVAAGHDLGEDTFRFAVPVNHGEAFQLGVVPGASATSLVLFEVPAEAIAAGQRRGSTIEVVLTRREISAAAIKDFSKRL